MADEIRFGRGFSGLIDLPIVSGDATVGAALDLMVAAQRSAVIVNEDRFHYLHTARSVLGAPQKIHPQDRLHGILSITGAPYLPMIDTIPSERWVELSPDLTVLRSHGVIDAVPQKGVRIGGLITQSGSDLGRLLASRKFPVKDLGVIITKCVCTDGHSLLPEEVQGGVCPWDGYPVSCG
jgi:hypothetical protein